MTMATQIFEAIDAEVRGCIGKSAPETLLMDLYWEVWDELKNRKGTSSGFTGAGRSWPSRKASDLAAT